MAKRLYIETYGCQMNVADTEVVFSILGEHGYERTGDISDADVILVMHKGSIVEYGSHQQLMEMNGMYAAMYREQEGRNHA